MTQLTEHFSEEEFTRSEAAIRLGLDNSLPGSLRGNAMMVAEVLEQIRAKFGHPIVVTSCYRAPGVNAAVGGSETSAHKSALAVDFTIPGFRNKAVCEILQTMLIHFDQLIYEFGESGWVHLGLSKAAPRGEVLSAVKVGGKTIYKKGIVG